MKCELSHVLVPILSDVPKSIQEQAKNSFLMILNIKKELFLTASSNYPNHSWYLTSKLKSTSKLLRGQTYLHPFCFSHKDGEKLKVNKKNSLRTKSYQAFPISLKMSMDKILELLKPYGELKSNRQYPNKTHTQLFSP